MCVTINTQSQFSVKAKNSSWVVYRLQTNDSVHPQPANVAHVSKFPQNSEFWFVINNNININNINNKIDKESEYRHDVVIKKCTQILWKGRKNKESISDKY